MQQLSVEHGSAPTSMREYEIGGKKYTVVSHYVGKKNVDNVLREIAVKRAYSDMENPA
jgi:hypothetical protein